MESNLLVFSPSAIPMRNLRENSLFFFFFLGGGFALFPKSIKQLKINLKIRYNTAKVDIKYTLKIHCNIDQDNVKTTVKNRQQK